LEFLLLSATVLMGMKRNPRLAISPYSRPAPASVTKQPDVFISGIEVIIRDDCDFLLFNIFESDLWD